MEECLTGASLSFSRLTTLLNSNTDDWAIALHLTGSPAADSVMSEIKKLVPKTAGKAITIVVQITADKADMAFPGRVNPRFIEKQMYVIKKGQLKRLAPVFSEGYRKDIESLLVYTAQKCKSRKIGLLINSHGGGSWGLAADTGTITMADLYKTISKGLGGSIHDKLDLMELEDSLMGKNGVYHEVACTMRNILAACSRPQWADGTDLIARIKEVLTGLPTEDPSKQKPAVPSEMLCFASPA